MGSDVQQVQGRVVERNLPKWCAARGMDPSAFISPDWSFLTDGVARWFLDAVEREYVKAGERGGFTLNGSKAGIFDHGSSHVEPQPMKLYKEGLIEVAIVGALCGRSAWPAANLRFQSPRHASSPRYKESKPWAFDVLAYDDPETKTAGLVAEAKTRQSDARALAEDLKACGARGKHLEADCQGKPNHHRKYQGLLEHRPRVIWIVGPESFDDEPDLAFRLNEPGGGVINLVPATSDDLRYRSGD